MFPEYQNVINGFEESFLRASSKYYKGKEKTVVFALSNSKPAIWNNKTQGVPDFTARWLHSTLHTSVHTSVHLWIIPRQGY